VPAPDDPGFGPRLAALRELAGLSQVALGRAAGLTHQFLARLERGERNPGWRTVQLLARALGVRLEELADPALAGRANLACPVCGVPNASAKRR
jgi:transcriptional regulator with XRE-family HTH domain